MEVKLIVCKPGEPGDERRKPPMDEHGHVMTRGPALGTSKPWESSRK